MALKDIIGIQSVCLNGSKVSDECIFIVFKVLRLLVKVSLKNLKSPSRSFRTLKSP